MTVATDSAAQLHRRPSGQFSAVVEASGRVALVGELDITRLARLREVLDKALGSSKGPLLVDAGGVSFIDESAISELLRYQLLAAAQQRRLCLDPVSDSVEMLVDVFDLRHILGPMRVSD